MPSPEQISSQLAEIQRTLGTLLGESKRAEEDRKHASDHRNRMHERIDELRDEMNAKFTRADESILMTGQIAAQARDNVIGLKKIVDDEIKPQTDDYRRIRTMGSGFMIAVALVAGTVGITLSDAIKAFFMGIKQALTGH